MKKLALLTLSLVVSSLAYADIAVRMSFKTNNTEATSETVRISLENPTAIFTFKETQQDNVTSDQTFKVVLTQEDPYTFNVIKVENETETLIAQPVIALNDLPEGTLSLGNDNETFTLTIERVE